MCGEKTTNLAGGLPHKTGAMDLAPPGTLMKTFTFVTACIALLVLFSPGARADSADSITFTFIGVGSTPPGTMNETGISLGPNPLLAVGDSNTNNVFIVPDTTAISTGAASSYLAAGGVLTANFGTGAGVEVEVDSADCVGGAMSGVCLQGSLNSGSYAAVQNGTGSFQGLFEVDYVSPWITALFGDPNTWSSTGSDSFNTSFNTFTDGGNTDSANVTAGAITFQTSTPSVPEPGSLTLLSAGIASLFGLTCLLSSRGK